MRHARHHLGNRRLLLRLSRTLKETLVKLVEQAIGKVPESVVYTDASRITNSLSTVAVILDGE